MLLLHAFCGGMTGLRMSVSDPGVRRGNGCPVNVWEIDIPWIPDKERCV